MKKPSQWTPQEAWEECKKVAARKHWCRMDGGSAMSEILALPFPADPPEVVSDDSLRMHSTNSPYSEVREMARELLARREAERKA